MNAPTDQSATAVATDQHDSVAGTWTTRTTATSPAGDLPPRGDVVATAVAAGERAAEIRRDQLTHDLERWKSVVVAIADGGEPDGRLLAEIAELTVRTQLPEGALAQDVAVVASVRKLEDRLKRAEAELENSVQTAAAKQAELLAARQRVRELENVLANGDRLQLSIASIGQTLSDTKTRNPRIFTPAAALARRLLAAGPVIVWSTKEVVK